MQVPKVRNMTSKSSGREIANQFIIDTDGKEVFQSYDSIIAVKQYGKTPHVLLDETYWDYSTTTGKYRNQFLGEKKKDTLSKIESGVYQLANLNLKEG